MHQNNKDSIMQPIDLGTIIVGPGKPTYLVAEIGINHNGDMELAKKTILAAKQVGANAVKFQNYKTEDFVPVRTVQYTYRSQGREITEFQYDLFKRCELSDAQIAQLKQFCDANAIDFHATPSNSEGVNLLQNLGVRIVKNGSDYLTNLPMIEHMGKSGMVTVLSTGMASPEEIEEAARVFRDTGNDKLILLHCTSRYPTPPEDIHLRKIKTLREAYGTLVGFSDHSEGTWAAMGAVTYGAVWIEKHFTLDKSLPGPDHWFSSSPAEFAELVTGVRFVEAALGDDMLGFTQQESHAREQYRLSCCAVQDLDAGRVLTASDIAFFRPGYGFPPKEKQQLIGKKLTRPLAKGAVITADDLA